jgi:hypothetical protein
VPIPHDIHQQVIIRKFQRQRLVAAGTLALAFLVIAYLLWIASQPAGPLPLGLPLREQLLVGLIVLGLGAAVEYVYYRCPNCHSRPLGKNWLGINPGRCPACKIGLR